MRYILTLLCAAALAATLHGPAPRLDSWQVIGPGGAGGMFLPTVSPFDPNLVLEHCDMTGSYISSDAGRSWRMFNLRGTASAFAFDPHDAKVIYTGSHALFRSEDTGKTWKMIFPDPARHTVEHMRDDHAAPMLTTDDPRLPARRQSISRIAIDPADSNRLYVVFGGLRRTQSRAALRLQGPRRPLDDGQGFLRRDPSRSSYFDHGPHVVTGSGVFRSMARSGRAPPDLRRAIQSASGAAGLLYVTSADGLFISRDCGQDLARPQGRAAAHSAIPGHRLRDAASRERLRSLRLSAADGPR